MMRVAQEFSRFAGTYGRHNTIQTKVGGKLISMLPERRYRRILDLGCGEGEIYSNLKSKNILFDNLTVMDISANMLDLHPDDNKITKVKGDFSKYKDFELLPYRKYDLILSASALQWSSDMDHTLSALSTFSDQFYFAIFTSGTFHSLHSYAGISSPIYSEAFLKETISSYFDAVFETVHYMLHFDSVHQMLSYIKKSGTSGGERHLGYREMKDLIKTYPYNYLEFEVLFASPKN